MSRVASAKNVVSAPLRSTPLAILVRQMPAPLSSADSDDRRAVLRAQKLLLEASLCPAISRRSDVLERAPPLRRGEPTRLLLLGFRGSPSVQRMARLGGCWRNPGLAAPLLLSAPRTTTSSRRMGAGCSSGRHPSALRGAEREKRATQVLGSMRASEKSKTTSTALQLRSQQLANGK